MLVVVSVFPCFIKLIAITALQEPETLYVAERSPVFLGRIHDPIGMSNQGVGILAIFGIGGVSDTYRDAPIRHGFTEFKGIVFNPLLELKGQLVRLVSPGFRQNNDKLVAAVACDNVSLAKAVQEQRRESFEKLVTA